MTCIPAIAQQTLRDVTGAAHKVRLRHIRKHREGHAAGLTAQSRPITEEDATCEVHQVDFEAQ
jgi:hypothetical protein